MRRSCLLRWIPLALSVAACAASPTSRSAPERSPPRAAPAEAPAPARTSTAPVAHREEPGQLVDLPVSGHSPALVWVPSGAGPRPLLVVAHGAGGCAEFHCDLWERITQDRAFVLCPRGARLGSGDDAGYFYRDDRALEREVLAAVDALRRDYPRVDVSAAVYVGYSQGAMMGAFVMHRHPDLFPRLVLIEGGHDWNIPIARRWREGGGERVLFVCGRQACRDDAARVGTWLERAGASVRIAYAPGAGHTSAGEVAARAAAGFGWVIEGDGRW